MDTVSLSEIELLCLSLQCTPTFLDKLGQKFDQNVHDRKHLLETSLVGFLRLMDAMHTLLTLMNPFSILKTEELVLMLVKVYANSVCVQEP